MRERKSYKFSEFRLSMKISLLILSVLLLVFFASCSTSNTTTPIQGTSGEDQGKEMPEMPGWCVLGQPFSFDGVNTQDAKIVSYEEYKNKSYCKGISIDTEFNATTAYYFTEEKDQMWIVTEFSDETISESFIDKTK